MSAKGATLGGVGLRRKFSNEVSSIRELSGERTSRTNCALEAVADGNILVETSDDAAQNGRYSIKYVKRDTLSYTLYVSITQLKQSDSGRYRCSLERTLHPHGNSDFELIVTEASTTSTPNGTLRPFSASVFLSSASTPPTAQSLSSTSGSSTPSSASTPPTAQSLSSTSGSSTPSSASSETKHADVLIYVGLILLVMIVVLSAALVICCMKRRTTKPRGPPVETEYADTQADNLCYAEVHFSHIPVTSSAPCGEATDVVYSMPQVDLSTAIHTKGASPPLYATVASL
ncbi:uncharacterized serine-rich protein C215.13 [Haplochromis burtoni]|uniref:uncharacterized serine-rich protein C215.13 n=1 Tax=Haplochromis burtoni TaxID=8153 RepID=UPI001C2DB649|nr:uncharacterized serine-rich protein C215.13 [Haplochromis burtoni]